MNRLLGITMGCPAGIGPEIVIRYHQRNIVSRSHAPVVVLGDPAVLARCAAELGVAVDIVPWRPGEKVRAGTLPVVPLSDLGGKVQWGRPTLATGRAMARYIEEAVRLIEAGILAGMVTCPISKSALNLAGYRYPGHTEMLAALCGCAEYAMMMAGNRLRVTLATIHVGLAEVPSLLSEEKIFRLIELTGRSLRNDFGIADPRLAVAGLNPHASETGLFGAEEENLIAPAVVRARAAGWQAAGPFPPDTVFNRAAAGQYDAVVCMYHDQGLIPFKLLHFADGVNVTLGLPIVRTSVDHGTAYDIAGQGKADAASLAAAVDLAGRIAGNRGRIAEKR
ncbi:MAG: 4-hydroxythreonine-4-phosphate dehydrogenase PdxA [Desulfurivibrionaceae bacterium]|nr:4-hydroxythreonine-4-phosphate dehydrogenase PdxA [Desulfobulbales bacterium]MDT8335542.1 4-hydroxythreonine-4-phosphate dehydrogenase PdxA [Desulfurivibrionaceae bacterium]